METATLLSLILYVLNNCWIASATASGSLMAPSSMDPEGMSIIPNFLRTIPFLPSTTSPALMDRDPMSSPTKWFFLPNSMDFSYSLKILFLSERLRPNANRIFRFVSILHGSPFSILDIVMGETFASLANSALLIRRDSRTSFSEFLPPIYYLHTVK